MVVDKTEKYHLVYLINMLINDESVELVNEQIELILTLNLIVLFCENFSLYLGFPDLLNDWEEKDHTNQDNDGLPLVVYTLESLS